MDKPRGWDFLVDLLVRREERDQAWDGV